MHEVYGDERFARLASISNGHLCNLRRTRTYRTGRLTLRETQPTLYPFCGLRVRSKDPNSSDRRPGRE